VGWTSSPKQKLQQHQEGRAHNPDWVPTLRAEDEVADALKNAGLEFQRERRVSMAVLGGTYCRVDFSRKVRLASSLDTTPKDQGEMVRGIRRSGDVFYSWFDQFLVPHRYQGNYPSFSYGEH